MEGERRLLDLLLITKREKLGCLVVVVPQAV
jgi:hypothetical protein